MKEPLPTDNQSPRELQRQIELEREGRAFLVLRDAEEQLVIVPLGTGQITVGRSEGAGVSLPWDPAVSGLHAELRPLGDEWLIVDDGLSRNGTFVNGERMAGRRRLRDRDVVRCGGTLILFRDPSAAGQAETAMASDDPSVPITPTQQRVLVALCRPFADGSSFATPATNRAIAAEVHLSVDRVKAHLRALFESFGLGDLPQNEKRVRLAELAVRSGVVNPRDVASG